MVDFLDCELTSQWEHVSNPAFLHWKLIIGHYYAFCPEDVRIKTYGIFMVLLILVLILLRLEHTISIRPQEAEYLLPALLPCHWIPANSHTFSNCQNFRTFGQIKPMSRTGIPVHL